MIDHETKTSMTTPIWQMNVILSYTESMQEFMRSKMEYVDDATIHTWVQDVIGIEGAVKTLRDAMQAMIDIEIDKRNQVG